LILFIAANDSTVIAATDAICQRVARAFDHVQLKTTIHGENDSLSAPIATF